MKIGIKFFLGLLAVLFLLKSCNPKEIENDQEIPVGQEIIFEIMVPKIARDINAAQIDLRYDEKRLLLTKVEENRNFFVYEVEKEYDNKFGWSRISGGLPHPGIRGPNLVLAKFYFQAKASGNAYIDYSPTSLVLADDGKAGEIYKLAGKKWYKIIKSR